MRFRHHQQQIAYLWLKFRKYKINCFEKSGAVIYLLEHVVFVYSMVACFNFLYRIAS